MRQDRSLIRFGSGESGVLTLISVCDSMAVMSDVLTLTSVFDSLALTRVMS